MSDTKKGMIWSPGDRVTVQTPDNLLEAGWPEQITGTVHKTRKNGWVVVRVDRDRRLGDFLPEWLTGRPA